MSREAGSEMGRWLSQMDWSYYVPWTFEEPKAPKVAAGIIKDHLETLGPKKAFWKIEEGGIGGVDIKKYESGKGAAHYVGQYLKGKVSQWDLYPPGDPTSGGSQWGRS